MILTYPEGLFQAKTLLGILNFKKTELDHVYKILFEFLVSTLDTFFPLISVVKIQQIYRPHWMPHKIQNAFKNKQKAYQKYLLTNSRNERSNFKQNKRKCVNMIRKANGYRINNFQKI